MFIDWQTLWRSHYSLNSSPADPFSSCGSLASLPSLSSGTALANPWAGQKSPALNNRNTTRIPLNEKTWGWLNWKSRPRTIASHQPAQWLLFSAFPIVPWVQHAVVHPDNHVQKMKHHPFFFFWKQPISSRTLGHFLGANCMSRVYFGSNLNSPIILCYDRPHSSSCQRCLPNLLSLRSSPAFSQPLSRCSAPLPDFSFPCIPFVWPGCLMLSI